MQKTKQPRKGKKGAFEYRTYFDSYSEYLATAAASTDGTSQQTGRESFFGTASMADALTLAKDGWAQGLEMITDMAAKLAGCSESELFLKPYIAWEVAGDFADAGLYATGVPECMGSFHEEIAEQTGKVVSILMNISVSGGISKDAIMARGACVLALVDALENAGKACEIHVTDAVNGYSEGSRYAFLCPVKAAGEHMELDRLAFVLAHPAMLRRLGFAVEEMEDQPIRNEFNYKSGGGYGIPTHLDNKTEAGRYNLIVPEMSLVDWKNGAAALKWVKQELANQGLVVEGFAKVASDEAEDSE